MRPHDGNEEWVPRCAEEIGREGELEDPGSPARDQHRRRERRELERGRSGNIGGRRCASPGHGSVVKRQGEMGEARAGGRNRLYVFNLDSVDEEGPPVCVCNQPGAERLSCRRGPLNV